MANNRKPPVLTPLRRFSMVISLKISRRTFISRMDLRMPTLPSRRPFTPGLLHALLVAGSLAAGICHAASGATVPPIANVVIGGAEQSCSSYTGSAQGRGCTADWDTILARDPAFKGFTKDDISFEPDYVLPSFTY